VFLGKFCGFPQLFLHLIGVKYPTD